MSVLWQTTNDHPIVGQRDYKRFLRFPPSRTFEGPMADNAAWARDWFAAHARPWSAAIRADDTVRTLAAPHFPGVTVLTLLVASAGPEAEAEAAVRWAAHEPDRYYFLECYAAATVEALLAAGRRRVGADKHLCPGYPGWPITDNHALLAALRVANALPGPLTVLPSGMLSPKKSQLAVCALCTEPVSAR
ncbi:MAG: hypothetical protein PSV13_08625 [Lacunisphaera sp.]|nr:hypothetical protein [Lacunisphaera sp.]